MWIVRIRTDQQLREALPLTASKMESSAMTPRKHVHPSSHHHNPASTHVHVHHPRKVAFPSLIDLTCCCPTSYSKSYNKHFRGEVLTSAAHMSCSPPACTCICQSSRSLLIMRSAFPRRTVVRYLSGRLAGPSSTHLRMQIQFATPHALCISTRIHQCWPSAKTISSSHRPAANSPQQRHHGPPARRERGLRIK